MDLLTKALRVAEKEGVQSVVSKSTVYILTKMVDIPFIGYTMAALYKHKLEGHLSKIRTLDDALDFAFTFSFLGISIKPAQVKKEVHRLLHLLKKCQLETILEIGTSKGGTLFLFARVAPPYAKIISVDLPGGPFGGGYPEWKIPLYLSFARANQRIYLLREDSHDPRTLNKVRSILGDQRLDFLFIDGDHSYEGVKRDFEMYSPLVRKGGIIAFHDIVEHPPETGCQVNRLCNEVKHRYTYIEIVEDWNQRWADIGVLFV